MEIIFKGASPQRQVNIAGLLQWQRNDLVNKLQEGLYTAMEKVAVDIEKALMQAVDDAVEAFYSTYSPRVYGRTENLKKAYKITCRFDRSQEDIIVEGDEAPTIEFMARYYSEADHGDGPEHRPLTSDEMEYIVNGLTVSGVRFYPKWKNPPANYPFEYGPISITFQLTKTQCTGKSIQDILTGDDIKNAINSYINSIVEETALKIYYDWVDSCRNYRGWDVRFKEK